MRLDTLLPNIPIHGLTSDSRRVQPGDCFLAYPGFTVDGRDYVPEAIAAGAVAVLYEQDGAKCFTDFPVPCIPVSNLQAQIGVLASDFYQYPSEHMTIVGVTGTNGKTTLTQCLGQLLQDCGVIGTTGFGFLPQLEYASHTTPDAITLQSQLHALHVLGAQSVAMEVSSHALSQGRVNGVAFDVGVFTNLSRDHLDYHADMTAYAEAKFQLFQQPGLRHAVINVDDPVGQQFLSQLDAGIARVAVSRSPNALQVPRVFATVITPLHDGFQLQVETPWGVGNCKVPLLGRFNIDNVLALIAVMGVLQYPLPEILHQIAALQPVQGRMEMIQTPNKPKAVIDFAHTPDALAEVLSALREQCQGQLWCVFGCGGNRDRGKRAMMGEIASTLADRVIVTNDNPRHEAPQAIADEICDGIAQGNTVDVILNRREAIAAALGNAAAEDIVLIAGKGHENCQIIGDKTFPFSDGEVVREQLQ